VPFKTVLVKGLGKIKFPGTMSDEAIESSIKNLDMSEAARMARAKEQGFDRSVYRGLTQPSKDEKNIGIIWTTPDPGYAGKYAGTEESANIMPLMVKSKKPFDFGFRTAEIEVKKSDMLDRIKDRILYDYNEGELSEDFAKKIFQDIKNIQKNSTKEYKPVWQFWQEDPDIKNILKMAGYDGIISREMGSNAIGVFSPDQVRGKFAAFNPDAKTSPSLLASAAPAAIGLGALGSNDANASVTGSIQGPAPGREKIATVSEFIDRHDDVVFDDLLGGVTSWLDKVAYDDKRNFVDRLMAALDLI